MVCAVPYSPLVLFKSFFHIGCLFLLGCVHLYHNHPHNRNYHSSWSIWILKKMRQNPN